MSDPLQALLNQHLQEGELHSSAAFSLDSVRARQKLSQYQLGEGYWLAKVVQAATRAGADQVSFRFGRRQVQADFPCALPLHARQILDLVLSGELPADPLLSHVVTAIRSSASHLTEWVEWSVRDSEGGELVRLDPHGVTVSASGSGSAPGFQLRVGLPSRTRSLSQTLSSPLSELIRSTVEENLCLRQRCWMAPPKIYCDGRLLASRLDNRLLWLEEGSLGKLFSQRAQTDGTFRCLMALRPLQMDGQPNLRLLSLPQPMRLHKVVDQISFDRITFLYGCFGLWPGLDGECQGYLAVLAQRTPSLDVDYILDGVVVDRYSFPVEVAGSLSQRVSGLYTQAGIRVWVAVQPEELDLSQFQLRNGEERAQRLLDQLSPLIQDTLQKVDQNLGDFNYLWMHESQLKLAAGLTTVIGSAALLGGNPLIGAWIMGGNLAMLPFNFKLNRSIFRKAVEGLRTGLTASTERRALDG